MYDDDDDMIVIIINNSFYGLNLHITVSSCYPDWLND